MKTTFVKAEELASNVKDYVNNRITDAKLSVAEKTSLMVARMIAVVVVALIFFLFIFFASTALAYALGKLTGEMYWGFLIVAAFYFLLSVLIWKTKESILRIPIMNAILHQLFNEADEKD
ncbi:hypothetical protein BH11BAC4_BH11BAC4_21300 [soil metagenome]